MAASLLGTGMGIASITRHSTFESSFVTQFVDGVHEKFVELCLTLREQFQVPPQRPPVFSLSLNMNFGSGMTARATSFVEPTPQSPPMPTSNHQRHVHSARIKNFMIHVQRRFQVLVINLGGLGTSMLVVDACLGNGRGTVSTTLTVSPLDYPNHGSENESNPDSTNVNAVAAANDNSNPGPALPTSASNDVNVNVNVNVNRVGSRSQSHSEHSIPPPGTNLPALHSSVWNNRQRRARVGEDEDHDQRRSIQWGPVPPGEMARFFERSRSGPY